MSFVSDKTVQLIRRIQSLRKEQGITQSDLSLKIGQAESYIGQIEQGRSAFEIGALQKITTALGLKDLFEWYEYGNSSDYQLTKGDIKNIAGPSLIQRNSMDNKHFKYYSLFDPVNNSPGIDTDFEMILMNYSVNVPTKKHFHAGDECSIVINGILETSYLSFDRGSNRSPEWESNILEKYSPSSGFFWIKSWIPHFYTAKKEDTWVLHLFHDPKGESGIYKYHSNQNDSDKTDGSVFIIDENNINDYSYDAVKTGIGLRLRRRRMQAELSIKELVKRCNTISRNTIKPSTIKGIESCTTNPTIDKIHVISEALGIDPRKLLPNMTNFNYSLFADSTSIAPIYSSEDTKSLLDNVSSRLAINILTINSKTPIKHESFPQDRAVFVLKGCLNFKNYGRLSEETEYKNQETIVTNDTIYIRKNCRHTLQAETPTATILLCYHID